jgi:uncharacterized membrane protein
MAKLRKGAPTMGSVRKFVGALLGFILKLAILIAIVNTIGGWWGMALFCGLGLAVYYAARKLGQPSA